MKLKLSKLNKAATSLMVLGSIEELSSKISYDVSKRLRIINPEIDLMVKTIEQKAKALNGGELKIINHRYVVFPENKEIFEKEYEELLDKEIELDLHPIKHADLGEIKLAPIHYANLDFLIQE
jgi:hypothetical protein